MNKMCWVWLSSRTNYRQPDMYIPYLLTYMKRHDRQLEYPRINSTFYHKPLSGFEIACAKRWSGVVEWSLEDSKLERSLKDSKLEWVIIYFLIYQFLVYKIHLQKNHKLHFKTPIHSNLESLRLHSNLESSRLHSTTPLHLLAHAISNPLRGLW
jgi:hypothetical protein